MPAFPDIAMKKISFLVFVFIICLLFTNSRPQLTAVSAQGKFKDFASQETVLKDRELAATIRRLTNRSAEGLTEKKLSGGRFMIDLQNRFQNVMLARTDTDGDVTAACVTNVDEANAFFGRNLESGEVISSSLYQKEEKEKLAARHGMSGQEFEFYKKLIEDAEIRRLASPNLATINIVNGDTAGEGFNSTAPRASIVTGEETNSGLTLGAQRLELFNFAAGIWGAFIDSSVPININSQFNSLAPCSTSGGVLGSAGTVNIHYFTSGAPLNNTWYHAALANKIAGSDLNTTNAEINARFNSDVDTGCLGAGTRFYYGLNNSTPSGKINLLVVLLHEMGHGLGFSSFISSPSIIGATNASPIVITTSSSHGLTTGEQVTIQNVAGNTAANGVWIVTNLTANTFQLVSSSGNGAYTGGGTAITGKLNSGLPDVYTTNMYDRTTGKKWNDMTNVERQASALNTGNVFWDGANVKIASGFLTAGREAATGRVQLFNPNPFQSGSSISHFDTAATTNLLMEPVINDGLSIDLDLTRQQMRDIGWFRDSTADTTADTITSVQPSGGTINTGTSRTITWTNTGSFNRNVTIEFSTDGGMTYSTIASNIANTGSYSWTVPNMTTTQGRIRVREYDFAAPTGVSTSNFSIALAPSSTQVSVSGRVTDLSGRGVSGAQITVNGSNGALIYARTNPFGYFSFKEIESGGTYIFQVSHKRHTFAPQVLTLMEDMNNLSFRAQP